MTLAATLLAQPQRRKARLLAKAQVPDESILEYLRAEVYMAPLPPEERRSALLLLQLMHEDDSLELDSFRGWGKATVQLMLFGAAVGMRFNSEGEAWDKEVHTPDEKDDFSEVSPVAISAAQFVARVWCVVDPAEIREEAAKEARRFTDMSDREAKAEFVRIGVSLGGDEAHLAQAFRLGPELVKDGVG